MRSAARPMVSMSGQVTTETIPVRSAPCPELELLRVAYRPDASNPPTCDLERDHGHGNARLLDDQAWLAVDRALEDRHRGCARGDFDIGARDLFAAVERAERGPDQATTVGDRDGVGVEEADERADVLCLPRRLEVPGKCGL